MLPVHFRVIGAEEDPDYPNRPRLFFAGEVRDGQTMVGRVEMTPDGHLRWKWVRLASRFLCCFPFQLTSRTLQVCGEAGQTLWRYTLIFLISALS